MERSMNSGYSAWLKRDLLLAYRHRGEAVNPLLFFVMVSILIPLGLTPESTQLALPWDDLGDGTAGNPIICGRSFTSDIGTAPWSSYLSRRNYCLCHCWVKMTAHWLTTGLPLTLVSPRWG